MLNRYHIMRNQQRAYTIGSIERINTEWIFFDEESEEASLVADIVQDGFEILYEQHWVPALLYENDIIKIEHTLHHLQNKDILRVPKKLQYSYEVWITELPDLSFYTFASTLQELGYSVYDSIFCHNSLQFQSNFQLKQGVNFIVYDNGDLVCAVQHQYVRGIEVEKDIFTFTRADGETRMQESI